MTVWTDGIVTMVRVARNGLRVALDPEEEAVVRALLATAILARREA